jgi:predicted transglutaminase-like cysteine proteinase
MRLNWSAIGGAVSIATIALGSPATAGLFEFPGTLRGQVERIALDQPALQPMAHTFFCLRYESECKPPRMIFRPKAIVLTEQRWHELVSVNRDINRSITPRRYPRRVLQDTWTLNPSSGDCNDYAVTKRHELMELGWPSSALLLAAVRTSAGEGHLVLVARTSAGDFVLDNLRHTIRPWSETRYEWVQMQSPSNPKFWATIKNASPASQKIASIRVRGLAN